MTPDTAITISIIGAVCFAGMIGWLTYELISAPVIRPWDHYADRVNTTPESYRDAMEMVITEEELSLLHEGKPK